MWGGDANRCNTKYELPCFIAALYKNMPPSSSTALAAALQRQCAAATGLSTLACETGNP
jgi:hypothetical protein